MPPPRVTDRRTDERRENRFISISRSTWHCVTVKKVAAEVHVIETRDLWALGVYYEDNRWAIENCYIIIDLLLDRNKET